MIKERFVHWVVTMSILGLIGSGMIMIETQPSFANCGGHCQAGKMCADLMSRKGLKDKDQRRDEYQKCMRDPQSYK